MGSRAVRVRVPAQRPPAPRRGPYLDRRATEPLSTALLAFVFLDESVTLATVIGGRSSS